jgi:hypothetical protein
MCGGVVFGRSDKRYCSPTCRRDASRGRTRLIRLGDMEVVGTEWSLARVWDDVNIAQLEREYGPNHRLIHTARRWAEEAQEERRRELGREMQRLSFFLEREVEALIERPSETQDDSDDNAVT